MFARLTQGNRTRRHSRLRTGAIAQQSWIRFENSRLRVALALALLVACAAITPGAARAQEDPVAALMAGMTSAEKVGQLFVVAFWGRNPSPPSRAGLLIQEKKIGGVILLPGNNNLVNQGESTLSDVARLTASLQGMALDDAGPGIPLFIAVDHEGDGYPYTRIMNGMTPLPSPMAVGATWDTRYAAAVGEIAGRELAALGINLLLGPALDVLNDPRPGGKGDIGTRAFGGDPYWVGEMGRAYIRGVHEGSEGRVLTVAKHFPGHGGSDRLPDDEVATVDKSLQELRRVELAPFFAVTNPLDPEGLDRTDALMSSHIRYRGFYGDIRQFTRPISFDGESMQALLTQPELRAWREEGLMVSDSLGVRAVRKYFDPQLQTFPHRQIAREAFLAGNDLLLLSEFALAPDWAQQYENTVQVVDYFRETYGRDPAFAGRVDEAAARILRHKLRLYPDFALETVLGSPDLSQIGSASSAAVADEVARQAVTVLQPTEDSLPRPPRREQEILILVEERTVRECVDAVPECDPRPLLPPGALEEAILALYGPEGTGQVDPARVHTRTYTALKAFLARGEGDLGPLLEGAEWIVFAMLDPNPRYPDSDALQLFLAQNAHQIYDARVAVLAYTAPYYLDATEISKLTAYYVFYGKTQPAIEASARALFGEVRPQGRSPVSIEGTYYDLNAQLAPDPGQQIVLERVAPEGTSAVVPVALRVRTRPLRDRNGNPVPDGTLVRVTARDEGSGQILDTALTGTAGGVAEASLTIARPGQVAVVAQSGDGPEGRPLAFEALPVPTPTPTVVRTRAVTPTPTATRPTPTSAPDIPASATPRPTPTATQVPASTPIPRPSPLSGALDAWHGRPVDLLGALGGALLAAGVGLLAWGRTGRIARRARLAGTAGAAWVGGLSGTLANGWMPAGWLPGPAWLASAALAFGGALLLVAIVALARSSSTEEG